MKSTSKPRSKNHANLAVFAILAALGCERNETSQPEGTGASSVERSSADNTKTNERDRNTATLTPGDQGESEADRTITQRVRQGVVGHDDLSTTAENVKIITLDGVVTLRGPVTNTQEKSTIAAIARGVDGVRRVDDQLEIAAP